MGRCFRRGASDLGTVVLCVIALAGGLLLYRAAAGAWMKEVVAAALSNSEDVQLQVSGGSDFGSFQMSEYSQNTTSSTGSDQ